MAAGIWGWLDVCYAMGVRGRATLGAAPFFHVLLRLLCSAMVSSKRKAPKHAPIDSQDEDMDEGGGGKGKTAGRSL